MLFWCDTSGLDWARAGWWDGMVCGTRRELGQGREQAGSGAVAGRLGGWRGPVQGLSAVIAGMSSDG